MINYNSLIVVLVLLVGLARETLFSCRLLGLMSLAFATFAVVTMRLFHQLCVEQGGGW